MKKISITLLSLVSVSCYVSNHSQKTPASPKPLAVPIVQPTSAPGKTPSCVSIQVREDQDDDGFGQESIMDLCVTTDIEKVLKEKHYIRAKANDIIDHCDKNAKITDAQTIYWDLDGDSYASETVKVSCDAPQSKQVAESDRQGEDDCDEVKDRFKKIAAFRDEDGDGFGVKDPTWICVGSKGKDDELLQGYVVDESSTRTVDECDTVEHKFKLLEVYNDEDGDGYGQGYTQSICVGLLGEKDQNMKGKVLVTHSKGRDDCDNNAEAQISMAGFVDKDADRWAFGPPIYVCVSAALGTKDPAFNLLLTREERLGEDCNDTDSTLHGWTFVWQDRDGDFIGAGAPKALCTAQTRAQLQSLSWSLLGYDIDDTDSAVIEDQDADVAEFLDF